MSRKIVIKVIANGIDETNKRLSMLSKTVSSIEQSQKKLSLARFSVQAIAVATAFKAVAATSKMVSRATLAVAAKYEVQRKAFGNLLQDVRKGTVLFEKLKTFASSTPLQLDDITQGTQKLLAFGVANDDVIDTMKRLGDLSMGVQGTRTLKP